MLFVRFFRKKSILLMIGFDFMSHYASYSVPFFPMWDSSSQYNTIFHFTFTISQEVRPVTCIELG